MAKKLKSNKDGGSGTSSKQPMIGWWADAGGRFPDGKVKAKKIPMSNSPEAKAERLQQYKNKERMKYEKTYEFNKPKKSAGEGTGKVTKTRADKAGGRAQPKGTPPRTGPGSNAGGQSARYSRLTGGGLMKHGR